MEFSGGIFGTNGTVCFFRSKRVKIRCCTKNDPVELGRLGRLVPRSTKSSTVGERMTRVIFLQMVQLIPVISVETKKEKHLGQAFLLFRKIFTGLNRSIWHFIRGKKRFFGANGERRMIIKHDRHIFVGFTRCAKVCGLFIIFYCAFRMLIGWASKLRSRGIKNVYTHRNQSTARMSPMSLVGRLTAVRTITIVTTPAEGIPAAPMAAAVAVSLTERRKQNIGSWHACQVRKKIDGERRGRDEHRQTAGKIGSVERSLMVERICARVSF